MLGSRQLLALSAIHGFNEELQIGYIFSVGRIGIREC